MGSIVLTLWELGWDTRGPDDWIDRQGGHWKFPEGEEADIVEALLEDAQILILDEATSNLDGGSDEAIQAMLRTEFVRLTVLTIAHRLHTIMDSSHVMLFDAGALAEFDDRMFAEAIMCWTAQSVRDSLRDETGSTSALRAARRWRWGFSGGHGPSLS